MDTLLFMNIQYYYSYLASLVSSSFTHVHHLSFFFMSWSFIFPWHSFCYYIIIFVIIFFHPIITFATTLHHSFSLFNYHLILSCHLLLHVSSLVFFGYHLLFSWIHPFFHHSSLDTSFMKSSSFIYTCNKFFIHLELHLLLNSSSICFTTIITLNWLLHELSASSRKQLIIDVNKKEFNLLRYMSDI